MLDTRKNKSICLIKKPIDTMPMGFCYIEMSLNRFSHHWWFQSIFKIIEHRIVIK